MKKGKLNYIYKKVTVIVIVQKPEVAVEMRGISIKSNKMF